MPMSPIKVSMLKTVDGEWSLITWSVLFHPKFALQLGLTFPCLEVEELNEMGFNQNWITTPRGQYLFWHESYQGMFNEGGGVG